MVANDAVKRQGITVAVGYGWQKFDSQEMDDVVIGVGNASTQKDIKAKVAKMTNKEAARFVGEQIAKLAKKKKISQVVFDRGGYLYTGRVKELADGARAAGLEF